MAQWRKQIADEVYTTDEIEARLRAELPPGTTRTAGSAASTRRAAGRRTLMVVNTVGHLAEAAWHHPDLTVSFAFVIVKLMNHAAKGVTDKDFELARKIEDVVMWHRARMRARRSKATPTIRASSTSSTTD